LGDIIKKLILAVLVLFLLLVGCLNQQNAGLTNNKTNEKDQTNQDNTINAEPVKETETQLNLGESKDLGEIKTFTLKEGEICKENGKPVIRLFSTTWCPHCVWIKETFDSTVKEYVDAGKITVYHWELDTGDNTLTEQVESVVPESELAVYKEFNPKGSIPTFVFGCKYSRIGNGFESTQDLISEAKEFRTAIETLLQEA